MHLVPRCPNQRTTRTSCFCRQVLSAATGAQRQSAAADVQDSVPQANSTTNCASSREVGQRGHVSTALLQEFVCLQPQELFPIGPLAPGCLNTSNLFLRSSGGAILKNDFDVKWRGFFSSLSPPLTFPKDDFLSVAGKKNRSVTQSQKQSANPTRDLFRSWWRDSVREDVYARPRLFLQLRNIYIAGREEGKEGRMGERSDFLQTNWATSEPAVIAQLLVLCPSDSSASATAVTYRKEPRRFPLRDQKYLLRTNGDHTPPPRVGTEDGSNI